MPVTRCNEQNDQKLRRKGVAVGAHPDILTWSVSTQEYEVYPEEEYADCLYQIGALSAFRANGLTLQHVSLTERCTTRPRRILNLRRR